MTEQITYEQFMAVDMRFGKIVAVEDFPEARKPAYKLTIDFGQEIGKRRSSAQITDLYSAEDLVGKNVIAVVNFPEKQIGPFMSQCLTLGVPTAEDHVALLTTNEDIPLGSRVF